MARERAAGKTVDWVPAWIVHLPSGEKVRIKRIAKEGPLIRFVTREGVSVILAPEAVAITIAPPIEDTEGFPIEFLDSADENESAESEERGLTNPLGRWSRCGSPRSLAGPERVASASAAFGPPALRLLPAGSPRCAPPAPRGHSRHSRPLNHATPA